MPADRAERVDRPPAEIAAKDPGTGKRRPSEIATLDIDAVPAQKERARDREDDPAASGIHAGAAIEAPATPSTAG